MTTKISRFIRGLRRNEEGATAIEYGLIAAGIAIVIIVAVKVVGNDLTNLFNNVGNNL